MAGLFDDLIPGAKPGTAGGGMFGDLIPAKPKPAGMLRGLADLGIEAASGVARGVKATADAFGADNAVSRGADTVDKFAREYLSAAAKADDQRVSDIMAAAQDAGVWEQVKAAAEAFTVKPAGMVLNAFGTSVPTIAAAMIPGVGQAGVAARLGALGAMGAAQGAGAVKGSIYEAVKAEQIKAGMSEADAEAAAVKAQEYGGENTANIAGGAALGGAASATGVQPVIAKMLQRGAEPVAQAQRGMLYRALNPEGLVARTGMGALKEAPLEAAQGGQEQYASNIALQNEGFDTPAFRGVAGSAALEGLASAGPGAAFAALDKPGANKKPGVADILGAPSVDEAIDFSLEAVTAPAKDEDKPLGLATGADGLPFEADPRFAGAPVLKGGERPAAPVFGSKQQADIYIGEQALFQSHESVEVAPGRWQVQPTAATRALLAPNTTIPVGEATEMLPVPDARELTDEERAEYVNAVPFSYRWAVRRGLPQPEVTELLPTGDATEVDPIPAADAFEELPAPEAYELAPVGEASELLPTPDVAEFDQVPAGEASELDAETIQADDLLARDGEPFTSKTGAQAKAYASGGGKVVAIPNHFGSGIPGYVVRPLMQARPNNTRGTDARDLPRSSNDDQRDLAGSAEQVPGASDGRGADAARSGGAVGLVPAAPGRVDQPAEAPSTGNRPADVVAGAGDADTALTPGSRVTLNGTPYTVTTVNGSAVKLQGADGGIKMVARNSKTFGQIQREPNEAARPQAQAAAAEGNAPAAAPAGAPAAEAVVPRATSGAVEADGVKQPDRVKVMTRQGQNVYVERADLEGDKPRMRHFTSTGKSLGIIVRENLDPTGELRRADAKEAAENPLFDAIGTKDGRVFASEAAAARELSQRGLKDTHEVAPEGNGFIVKRRAPERRKDLERRKRVNEMTPDEMRAALLTDDLTGLNNGRWLRENQPSFSHIIAFDADSLKWVNDNMGHEAGDMLLKAWGAALQQATPNSARMGGDEFFAMANSEAEAQRIASAVESALAQAVITASTPDGDVTIRGIGASFGIAQDRKAADEALNQHKREREAAGTRAGRGEQPPGTTRKPAGGQQDQADRGGRQDDPAGQEVAPPTLTPKAQAVKEALAAKKGAQPEPAATHKDPGEPAEPVTPAVVREAIKTAADNRDRPIKDVKADALRLIDEAMPNAKPSDDMDVQMYEATAPGVKMTQPQQAEYKRLSGQARDKYMQRLANELAAQHQRAADNIGYVTIKVPGDGVFKVLNTAARLAEFRKKVEASPGFKAQRPGPIESPRVNGSSGRYNERAGERFGVEDGSGGKLAAFDNMVNEGDLEAASDYADAVGLELDPKKLANATKVLKWRETRPATTPEAAAQPEAEAPAPTAAPAEQAAAILNAAAEPPKGAERLSVIKDVKAGAITPEEVAAAYPPVGEVAAVEPAGETGPRSIIDGPGADAQFSRATPGRNGVPMADAKAVVATIREALPTAPEIVLHDSVRRAPENLRRLIRQAGADNDVEAVYHDGEIHVFPGNISSIERMQFVVAHHEVRHHGLRSMLGPQMGPAMLRMYASNANLKAAADAKMAAGLADTRILAVEEALADMPVEELQKLTGWARIVAAARQWLRQAAAKLRRAGLNTLADAMEPEGWTDNDIAALVQRAEDVSRGGAAPFNSGGTVFQRAYHGTPYRGIERFDTEAIGTGEGAQAYGWGLYFASKREVADFYRRKLSGESDRVFTKDGRTIQGPADLAEAYYQPGRIVRGYSGADKVLEFKRTDNGGWVVKVVGVKANGDPMEFERPRWHATQPDGNTLRDALEEDGWKFSPAGQLYEVEVPEDSELLLWDKPLSEQPAMVREAIREAIGSMDPENAEGAMRKGDDLLGSNAYTLLQTSDRISGAEGASELLASLGVKGIKYLDGTSRGGRGNGHNYVIFSGDDVAIQQALFSRADQTQTPSGQRATNDSVPADTNAPGQPGGAQGADSGRSATDKRLTRQELDRGIAFVRQVEALAEQHGAVYIRWSPGSKRDLKPDSVSRDFVAGSTHSGLSAVEVKGDTHYADIASALAEYGFLRMQDRASLPRVYLGKRIGTDSDSHALIRPRSVALEVPADVVALLDKGLADAIQLQNSIETDRKRLERITDPAGRRITEAAVAANQAEFDSLLNDQPAPDSGGAVFSRAGTAKTTAPDWITSGSAALQGAAGKIDTYAPQKTMAEKAREMSAGWKQKMVQGMFDAYAPLKALSMDAYIAARMTKAADGAFEGMLMYGKPVMNADGGITGDLDGKGFLGAMRELNGEHDRFFMWLAGNRAERLYNETTGWTVRYTAPTGTEVVRNFEATEEAEKDAYVAKHGGAQVTRHKRENLFELEEIKAMKALNQGDMPAGTVTVNGVTTTIQTRPRIAAYKRALDEFNAYSKSVLDVAEKAGLIDGESRKLWEHDFYVPFYRMSQENEISGPTKIKGLVRQKAFERLKGGKENLGDLMNNTLRNWSHLLSASLANVAASKSLLAAEQAGVAFEAKEAQAKEMAKAAGLKGNATYFMDQGMQRWFVVEDPAILQAVSAMEAPALNGLPLQLMAKFKKYLTVGVTIAPAFKVRNLIRDTLAAPAANEMSFNIAKNLSQGWKATDTKTAGYAQMLFSGGLMRFGTYLEGDRAEHVKWLISQGVDDKTILNTPQKVKAMFIKAWDAWQDFGDRMENVNRTALYQQLLDKGMSPREAAFQARDMMDFSLQGSWAAVRTLTAVIPFLNARAQGLYKLGRAAATNPKRMGYMVAAVSLASIILMLAYEDDEDWKAREDWDRDAWWWFKIGDTAYRIPKPFEIGAMGTIAERSVELLINDEMTGARFAERMKQMVTGTFAINPVPQMFKPMLDLYANKDSFTGRQIETLGMERLSKQERYGPNTSALAKALGYVSSLPNKAGLPGENLEVSPVQADHLIRAYFGWLGTMGAATVDAATSPFSDIEKPTKKVDDYFGGFVKELPAASSRYLEDFYKQAKETSEAMADLRRAREVGDTEKAAEIMEERGDKVALYRVYQQAQRQLADLNKRIRLVRGDTSMDGDTKRLRLDELTELRNRIARQVSDRTRAREAVPQ